MTCKTMHQICYSFYWSIKKWSKLGYFWLNLRVFLFTPSYTLWDKTQDFPKWKAFLRYISVVNFISIAYVVVKLKIFKVFCINLASMNWPLFVIFWAFTAPNIVWSCWNFDQSKSRPVSNKTNTVFEKSFKILNFGSNETHLILQFWFILGPNLPLVRKPKILLKPKISAKTASLGIISNVSPSFQQNHRILVKLSWKKHFGDLNWV